MSESRSSGKTEVNADELEEIAAELYARRPDVFAAARDEHVRQARAAGRPALARELNRLRRPTQSAWLINLLWRDQREVMDQLLQLASELGQAQAHASGADLHRLGGQRRELEAALLRRARSLAEKAGVGVSAATEREAQETLAAALARPEVADEVRTGRLVKPATYAGFGTLPVAALPAAGEQHASDDADRGRTSAPRAAKIADFEAKVAERAVAEQRRRAKLRNQAERDVAEARAALEGATRALAERDRAAQAALEQQGMLPERLAALEQQLRELHAEMARAEEEVVAARGDRDQAEKVHAAALGTLDQAEQHLQEAAVGDF
ncbi:MAG: hypothetical protein LC797_09070 [Chloroflexi bacterium]|nr:hypothetical protein [Chloroflexota bacterium]